MSYENYHKFLKTLAAAITEEADMDALVAVTGLRGTGKSTFSLGAARRIEKLTGNRFDLKENVLWTYEQAWKALTDESSIHAGVLDEAVFVALNRDWQKSGQKKLLKLINASREYHKITFWNIPYFRRLDVGIREHFSYWVWIPKRGHAVVFVKSVSPFATDPWHLDYFEKYLAQRVKHAWDVDEVIDVAQELPNYLMDFKFPKVEESLLQRYKQIAREMKKRVEAEEVDEKEKENWKSEFIRVPRYFRREKSAVRVGVFSLLIAYRALKSLKIDLERPDIAEKVVKFASDLFGTLVKENDFISYNDFMRIAADVVSDLGVRDIFDQPLISNNTLVSRSRKSRASK